MTRRGRRHWHVRTLLVCGNPEITAIRFPTCRRAVRLDVRGVDPSACQWIAPSQQTHGTGFPDAAPRPAHKSVIDRCRRTYSGGQSGRAIAPAAAAFALITRLSSTRSTPRTSVGRFGLIRDHCSSLSQNKFLRTSPFPLSNSNQDGIVRAQELIGFHSRLRTRRNKTGDRSRTAALSGSSDPRKLYAAVDLVCWSRAVARSKTMSSGLQPSLGGQNPHAQGWNRKGPPTLPCGPKP
jgi:hypothetical protein